MSDGRRIQATFAPKRLDTLREEAKPYVGTRGEFRHLWVIDEEDGGPYVGQSAWQMMNPQGVPDPYVGWIPDEDLSHVLVTDEGWA